MKIHEVWVVDLSSDSPYGKIACGDSPIKSQFTNSHKILVPGRSAPEAITVRTWPSIPTRTAWAVKIMSSTNWSRPWGPPWKSWRPRRLTSADDGPMKRAVFMENKMETTINHHKYRLCLYFYIKIQNTKILLYIYILNIEYIEVIPILEFLDGNHGDVGMISPSRNQDMWCAGTWWSVFS